MGLFSWIDCCDDNQNVLFDVLKDVYVLIPKEFGGGHIKESRYDGYGHFAGEDIYELVVDWNKEYLEEYRKDNSFECKWLQEYSSVDDAFEKMDKRDIGISIACYDEDNERIKYPIKITYNPDAIYEDCKPSKSDINQGYPNYEQIDKENEERIDKLSVEIDSIMQDYEPYEYADRVEDTASNIESIKNDIGSNDAHIFDYLDGIIDDERVDINLKQRAEEAYDVLFRLGDNMYYYDWCKKQGL